MCLVNVPFVCNYQQRIIIAPTAYKIVQSDFNEAVINDLKDRVFHSSRISPNFLLGGYSKHSLDSRILYIISQV